MPANLTPDFQAARDRFKAATTAEERLVALQDMLRTIPKHKGTDKMQADIKKRIARNRDQVEQQQRSGKQRPFWIIEKQGAGTLTMAGPSNTGKSALMKALTNASPEVAPYPFTTQMPMPAMVPYRNIQFQLIDTPPLVEGHPGWLMGLIREADIVLLVQDLSSDDVLTGMEQTMGLFDAAGVELRTPVTDNFSPKCLEAPDYEDHDDQHWDFEPGEKGFWHHSRRKALVVANKLDSPGARDRLQLLKEMTAEFWPSLYIHPLSVETGEGLDEFKGLIFELLEVVRVVTKAPREEPNMDEPFVLPRGSTLLDAAAAVHKDFAASLKYAKVWGKKTFDGQMVEKDYILEDGDVVELHI